MRTRRLEEIQQRFGLQQQQVIALEGQHTEIQTQVQHYLNNAVADVTDPLLSQQRFHYIQFLKRQAEYVKQQIRQEKDKLEKLRDLMRQALVQKKSLELLEQKQKEKYLKHLEAEENKILEDIIAAKRYQTQLQRQQEAQIPVSAAQH